MKPKLSIICPAYNVETYISTCIKSVLDQSFKDFEFIIINDGSTDNTENIILGFNDNRIKYIKQNNQGVSIARNVGLNCATGDYIGFIDSDDFIHKDRYKIAIEKAIQYNCDIVQCGIINVDADGNTYEIKNAKNVEGLSNKIPSYPGSTPVKIIKSSIIQDNNIRFYEGSKYGEDTIFMSIVYSYSSRIYCIDQILYYRNIGRNSITSNKRKNQYLYNQNLLENLLKCRLDLISRRVDKMYVDRVCRYIRNTKTNLMDYLVGDGKPTPPKNIISNNCIGAMLYKLSNIRYDNPFMWCRIEPQDFLKLMKDFNTINLSKIDFKLETYKTTQNKNVVGILSNGVRLHFTHYLYDPDANETRTEDINVISKNIIKYTRYKWNSRLDKMSKNRNDFHFMYSTFPRTTLQRKFKRQDDQQFINELLQINHKITIICDDKMKVQTNKPNIKVLQFPNIIKELDVNRMSNIILHK